MEHGLNSSFVHSYITCLILVIKVERGMRWVNDFFFLTPEAVRGLILLLTKKTSKRATDTAQFYLRQIHPAAQRSRRVTHKQF